MLCLYFIEGGPTKVALGATVSNMRGGSTRLSMECLNFTVIMYSFIVWKLSNVSQSHNAYML